MTRSVVDALRNPAIMVSRICGHTFEQSAAGAFSGKLQTNLEIGVGQDDLPVKTSWNIRSTFTGDRTSSSPLKEGMLLEHRRLHCGVERQRRNSAARTRSSATDTRQGMKYSSSEISIQAGTLQQGDRTSSSPLKEGMLLEHRRLHCGVERQRGNSAARTRSSATDTRQGMRYSSLEISIQAGTLQQFLMQVNFDPRHKK